MSKSLENSSPEWSSLPAIVAPNTKEEVVLVSVLISCITQETMSPSQLSAEGDLVLIFVRVLSLSVSLSEGVYCGLSKAKSVETLPELCH